MNAQLIDARHAPALQVLLTARRTAEELGEDLWQFAIGIERLRLTGLCDSEIRKLVCLGYAEHGIEVTRARSRHRRFQRICNLALRLHSCFVLTEAGVTLQKRLGAVKPAALVLAGRRRRIVPRWDAKRQSLFWEGIEIKHYHHDAPNQTALLSGFQAQDWQESLLVGSRTLWKVRTKTRLRNTIHALNRSVAPYLHFRQELNGECVVWELGPRYPRDSR